MSSSGHGRRRTSLPTVSIVTVPPTEQFGHTAPAYCCQCLRHGTDQIIVVSTPGQNDGAARRHTRRGSFEIQVWSPGVSVASEEIRRVAGTLR
jgi:hypothetical protein